MKREAVGFVNVGTLVAIIIIDIWFLARRFHEISMEVKIVLLVLTSLVFAWLIHEIKRATGW